MAGQKNQTQQATPEKSEADLRQQAVGKATTRLKHEYAERFAVLAAEECRKVGVAYKRRLTEEEKAERDLNELIKAHPHLEEQLRQQYGQRDAEDNGGDAIA